MRTIIAFLLSMVVLALLWLFIMSQRQSITKAVVDQIHKSAPRQPAK